MVRVSVGGEVSLDHLLVAGNMTEISWLTGDMSLVSCVPVDMMP